MKYSWKVMVLQILLISGICTGFFTGRSGSIQAETKYKDTLVLTCHKSASYKIGPGEFLFRAPGSAEGPGTRPLCFTIDAAGRFYIPTADRSRIKEFPRGQIKVQIFDQDGNFLKTLALTGVSYGQVDDIAVTPAGEIYLPIYPIYESHQIICKFNAEGQLLYKIGPEGIISSDTETDTERFRDLRRIFSIREGYLFAEGYTFDKSFKKLYIPNNEGKLEVTDVYPPEIAEMLKTREQKCRLFYEILRPEAEKIDNKLTRVYSNAFILPTGSGLSVNMERTTAIGPDGNLYYMILTAWKNEGGEFSSPQELQIHKVEFLE